MHLEKVTGLSSIPNSYRFMARCFTKKKKRGKQKDFNRLKGEHSLHYILFFSFIIIRVVHDDKLGK